MNVMLAFMSILITASIDCDRAVAAARVLGARFQGGFASFPGGGDRELGALRPRQRAARAARESMDLIRSNFTPGEIMS